MSQFHYAAVLKDMLTMISFRRQVPFEALAFFLLANCTHRQGYAYVVISLPVGCGKLRHSCYYYRCSAFRSLTNRFTALASIR